MDEDLLNLDRDALVAEIRYRESLDRRLPNAPRTHNEFEKERR